MKRIVKEGKGELKWTSRKCYDCGCQFEYTADETCSAGGGSYLTCPWCGKIVETFGVSMDDVTFNRYFGGGRR